MIQHSTLNKKKIRVLLVDDSAVVRQVITEFLSSAPDIEIMAAVADPIFAMKRMEQSWPDVIILDIEMPRMDGLTFLQKIMQERPTPVVICSTLTEKGAETTFQALSLGAVSIITKPKAKLKSFLEDSSNDIVSAVRSASNAQMKNVKSQSQPASVPPVTSQLTARTKPGMRPSISERTQKVVAIGTSTGGTQALEMILSSLPAVSPGILIVQHMPEKFTALFAERLNKLCQIEVREAKNGDRLLPGLALIAPGGKHMQLKLSGSHYQVGIIDGPPVNRHKPSVDVLFKSVASFAGRNSAGFILTGMGDDGARGLRAMQEAGAFTVAQDEASCIVFGMPKEAIALGAAQKVLPLNLMANEIMACVSSAHL